MRAGGVDAGGRCEFGAFAGHFGEVGQKVEQGKQTVSVAVGLIGAPGFRALAPDCGEVFLRGEAQNLAVRHRHAARASGP